MAYPPLVVYGSASEYRSRFERMYCQAPIITFDGIEVRLIEPVKFCKSGSAQAVASR